jgi:vacuolar protein-sorting-associated protein 4
MSYVDFVSPALDLAKRAVDADEASKHKEAYDLYLQAVEHFMVARKHEKNEKKRQLISSKTDEILRRAEQLKEYLDNANKPKKTKKQAEGGGPDDDDGAKMRGAIESAIVREKPNVHWDDIAGLEGAKEALKEAVILPLRFPQLFTGKREPWRGILLYGPPGTGKSYLAKAIATEADATFFSVSSADLTSKYLGESEKLVRELFTMAREAKPAIIFIDEIDSLASTRGDNESESGRRIKTEFLVQMQGVGKDTQGVLVLAATNLPWGIDAAVRRRFERRIYIPLPDAQARMRMFQIHIGSTPHSLTEQDLRVLAETTDGYSGSDIAVLVRNALMEPVRKCQNATHFVLVPGDKWTPCSPGEKGAVAMELMQIPGDKLIPPVVTMRDFERAMLTARPSVSKEDLKEYVKFTEDFGSEA